MTDEQLINGCIDNNALAQKQLYDRYARKMMGVCLRYCEDEEEAEDILQNGFIHIFEHVKSFKGAGNLDSWVRKIIINTALTHLRRNKNLKQNINLDSAEFILPPAPEGESFEAKELLKLIQTLPTGFRTVFNLYAIEGYSHKEIGDMLGISEGTSKSQYSRAKLHLQKLIHIEEYDKEKH